MNKTESTNSEKANDMTTEEKNIEKERILCNHCRRTKTNGIRCQGMCVADNEY